jgi:hypothetical protein
MTTLSRAQWCAAFVEALRKLRPHLSVSFAETIADIHYSVTTPLDPQLEAQVYHSRQLDQIAAGNRRPEIRL